MTSAEIWSNSGLNNSKTGKTERTWKNSLRKGISLAIGMSSIGQNHGQNESPSVKQRPPCALERRAHKRDYQNQPVLLEKI